MKYAIAVFLFAMTASAVAQQPSPSQTAIQIDNVINQWAQTIEAQQRTIDDLRKQLEEAKAPKPLEKK